MLDGVMDLNQLQNQRMFGELKNKLTSMLGSSNTQVMDEFRADVSQFCAELQRIFRTEMGQEVERKVSERIAPLQEELAAMKVEIQQLKERVESAPTSTSQQQAQPDMSKLEDKVHRLEQATVQNPD
ncbi:hypothetical protein ABBQ32_012084 [Trebouxia sp. C0010 RCD-2024]